jgi:hypothetical protein
VEETTCFEFLVILNGIVAYQILVECCQCSAVINNNCNIFQAVVGDEGTVFVVLEM